MSRESGIQIEVVADSTETADRSIARGQVRALNQASLFSL
jgi:hypothetical protein